MRPVKPAGLASAVAAAAGYPLLNMLNDHMGIVFRSSGGQANDSLTVDLGASPPAVGAALFFGCTGAKAGWTLSVSAADDIDQTVNVLVFPTGAFLAGATFPTHGRGVGYWESAAADVTRRYWRFTFGGLGGDAVTIARLAMGPRLRLDRNFGFGGAFGVRDFGRFDLSPNAAMLRRRAPKLRVLSITFPSVTKDEAEEKVQPLLELAAGQELIVIVTDPEAHAQRQRRCWIGPLIGELGTVWATPRRWEWRAGLLDMVPIPAASSSVTL
jgi:hypothetical protein